MSASSFLRSIPGGFGKADNEAVLDVGMQRRDRATVLLGEDQVGDVLGRVRHLAVLDGAIDDVLDRVRVRAEDVGPGDDDFLADPKNDLGVELEVRVEQVEVFDDDAPAVADGFRDDVGDFPKLVEGLLVAHVDVVGVRTEAVGLAEVEDRRGAQVDAFVVVGQLKAGENAANQRRRLRLRRR